MSRRKAIVVKRRTDSTGAALHNAPVASRPYPPMAR